MIALVIIVLDECFNRFLQFTWHLVGHKVNLSFDSAVVSFYLTIGFVVRLRRAFGVSPQANPQSRRSAERPEDDKGKVLALTRFRGSQGAPERRILGAAASDKHAPGSLWGCEEGLTAAWHGGYI